MTKKIITQPIFGKTRHIHMVGIGGIGMSGIAEILLHKGYQVSGSDGSKSETTERLESIGARIFVGHDPAHIAGADVVVYTSAVLATENVETKAALDLGIPVIKRAEMLAELMRMKVGIGIAGTHGKTTTTTMTGLIVREGDFDPTIIVGGRVHSFDKTNAVVGKGDIIIVEADEYDRTFLKLSPTLAVITNIDLEHLDIYSDLDDLKNAFIEFANKVPFYGAVVLCLDDKNVASIMASLTRKVITYGFTPQAQIRPVDISNGAFNSSFTVLFEGQELGRIHMKTPGDHNIRNALAAVGIGLELGIPFERIKAGLDSYSGVFRRFQQKYEDDEIMVIDDYAHHPTEAQATLNAARKGWPKRRVIAVFQPHLYSRTRDMQKEFGLSFFDSDVLIVTDVYGSREKPLEGINGELLVEMTRSYGHKNVHYVPNKKEIPDFLMNMKKPGDIVITMGAGDIYQYGDAFVSALKSGKGVVA